MQYQITRKNAPISPFRDLYHRTVKLSWPRFLSLIASLFLILNFIFAGLYSVEPSGLHPQDNSFSDRFFFSIHTFSTVGYGTFSPSSLYTNIVVSLEIFIGLISMALTTGLLFAKFSLPSAKVLFTKKILITKMDGQEALVFRLANARSNQVIESKVRINVLYDEYTKENQHFRRFVELDLRRSTTPIFSLSLTCVHEITDRSPVKKLLQRIRDKDNVEFLVSISGLDDTYGQNIHALNVYGPNDIHWGGQWADVLDVGEAGVRSIDFKHFDTIIDT